MMEKILVGYATKYGSTQEVASFIADVFREPGGNVDLQELRDVRSLDGYRAVVIGAPFYMFKWMKDARQFLSRHQEALSGIPVAVFALGPTEEFKSEEDRHQTYAQLDKALVEFPWLKPVDQALFGGKFDPANLKFPISLFMGKMAPSDLRDWDQIRAWAEDVRGRI